MNPEIYAEWLRRQGHKVIRTASSYWHNAGLRVYQAFPYHWLVDPGEAELSEIFYRHGAIAVRYCQSPESATGCASHAIVFEGSSYGLENLGHRTRKNVRRGLRNCSVEPISFQSLVDQGWNLRCDALQRQGRNLKVTYELWRDRYLGAGELRGFQAWGATVAGRFAGYLVTFQMDDCLCIIDHQSHRDFLDMNVNNAMTFVVSQQASAQPAVNLLFYGLESLDAPPSVSEFKFRMGYTAKPIRQRVVFHPQIAALANGLSYRVVSLASKWLPANRSFAKAKGMLRLCLAEKGQAVPVVPSSGEGRAIEI